MIEWFPVGTSVPNWQLAALLLLVLVVLTIAAALAVLKVVAWVSARLTPRRTTAPVMIEGAQ